MQAVKERSSAEVSPSKGSELEGDRAALAKELADVKKRFLAVAKKKQADFAKRVPLQNFWPPDQLQLPLFFKMGNLRFAEASCGMLMRGRSRKLS